MGKIQIKNAVSHEIAAQPVPGDVLTLEAGAEALAPGVLREEKQLRAEESKFYKMNDGTVKAVVTGYPVHYRDEQGEFCEIDNRLIDGQETLVTNRSGFQTVLSKFASEDRLIRLTKGLSQMEWSYVPAQSAAPVAIRRLNADSEASGNQAVYENIDADVDLEYQFLGTNVKENIVVKSKKEAYRYAFRLKTHNLKLAMSDDGANIELYEEKVNEAGESTRENVFRIPCPYMFDGTGEISEDVRYEIEPLSDGEYAFTVIADADWINQEERAMPVTIDPQIILYRSQIFAKIVYHKELSTGSGGNDWIGDNNEYLKVTRNSSRLYKSVLTIDKSKFTILDLKISKATLVLTRNTIGTSGNFYMNGRTVSPSDVIKYDITSLMQSSASLLNITMEPSNSAVDVTYFFNSEKGPRLEIEYITNEKSKPVRQTFSLAGGATGELDLLTGDFVTGFCDVPAGSSVLGWAVSHVYKQSADELYCGKNFRLNLHETLNRNYNSALDASYIYTDAKGEKHAFKEYFYYIDGSGKRAYVSDKSSIRVDPDGKLYNGSNEVFKEERSSTGLTAMTVLEGVNDVEYLEQRQEERIKAEEQLEAYENRLNEFVTVDYDGVIKNHLKSYLYSNNTFESFVSWAQNSEYWLMTENEANTYKSFTLQCVSLELQKNKQTNEVQTNLDNQKIHLENQQSALRNKRYDYLNLIKKYYKEYTNYKFRLQELNRSLPVNFLTDGKLIRGYNQAGRLVAIYDRYENSVKVEWDSKGRVTRLVDNEDRQVVFDYHKNGYYHLKSITDVHGKRTKFDYEAEYLKEITFADGRILKLSYDTDFQELNLLASEGVCTSIVFTDRRARSIKHNTCDKDCVNLWTVNFDYSECKTVVTDDDGKRSTYLFNGDGNLSGKYVEENGAVVETIAHDFVADTCEYTVKARKNAVNHLSDITKKGVTSTCLLKSVSASELDVHVTDYMFSAYATAASTKITPRYQTDFYSQNLSVSSPLFELRAQAIYPDKTKTFIASFDWRNKGKQFAAVPVTLNEDDHGQAILPSSIYLYVDYTGNSGLAEFEDFSLTAADWSYRKLNSFGNPSKSETGWKEVSTNHSTFVKNSTEYTYDEEQRLIQERTCRSTAMQSGLQKDYAVKRYCYDAGGNVIRTESYVEGEEQTSGVAVTESVYDKTGNLIRATAYNSLDTSSKFYTESVYDEDGRVTATPDATGEHSTEYEYDAANQVSTQKNPDGSRFAYGRDAFGKVTAITKSTETGEENSTQLGYEQGLLTTLKSGNNQIKYKYDRKRRLESVDLNGTANYVKFEYPNEEDEDNLTEDGKKVDHVKSTFVTRSQANVTDVLEAKTDKHGNVLETVYNGAVQLASVYDADDKLISMEDKVVNYKVANTYDEQDRLFTYSYTKMSESGETLDNVNEIFMYDAYGKLKSKSVMTGSHAVGYQYGYKDNFSREIESVAYGGNVFKVNHKKDCLGRPSGKEFFVAQGKLSTEDYYYRKVGDHATNQVSTVRYGSKVGDKFVLTDNVKYSYDASGNVQNVYENGMLSVRYAYDKLNRIVREDNKRIGKTYLFDYDNNGNILCRRELDFTLKQEIEYGAGEEKVFAYQYDGDRLMGYGSDTFTYDEIGNPLTYRGIPATWAKARQLTAFGNNTFQYDGQGRRIRKNNIQFNYGSDGNLINQSNGIEFIYDNTGIAGILYNSQVYAYRKNIFGDVTEILDNSGNIVVKYVYDGWGNHAVLSVDEVNGKKVFKNYGETVGSEYAVYQELAKNNPIRYRSYYYDDETGFYYLKSRYYDPEIGRFISIDSLSYLAQETINGLNLYAYCLNNPVMGYDPTGTWSFFGWLRKVVTGAVAAIAGAVIGFVTGGFVGMAIGIAAGLGLGVGASFVIDWHYARNDNLIELPNNPKEIEAFLNENGWEESFENAAHQFTSADRSHRKFLSPDGKQEFVFDSEWNVIYDPRDIGTYNYFDYKDKPFGTLGHAFADVIPWILWGNSADDSTWFLQRFLGLLGIYI